MEKEKNIRDFLDRKVREYSTIDFIKDDPVLIPHLFSKKQDQEIAAFFAAIFAWGNRATIINKSKELMQKMSMAPHHFCLYASPSELNSLKDFKHRTFNADDLFFFIQFFREHYSSDNSLETAFTNGMNADDDTIENGLCHFRNYFFSKEHLRRTEKHIASPARHSACKRINMFLRWMVRKDAVDLGLWKKIKPSQLVCPLDLHVTRVAKRFGFISRPVANWNSALELTHHLRQFDPNDPVKYDFAFFALGVIEKY